MALDNRTDIILCINGTVIETVQQFYLKSSDANEKRAVGVLEELMEKKKEGSARISHYKNNIYK